MLEVRREQKRIRVDLGESGRRGDDTVVAVVNQEGDVGGREGWILEGEVVAMGEGWVVGLQEFEDCV